MGDPLTVGLMGAGIGLAYLGGKMLAKDKNGFEFDNRPTPLASRGVWVPRLFGRHLLAPIFAWCGDRVAEKVETGGKGLGSSATENNLYKESSCHILCVGPAKRLYRIIQNGKCIYKPSGGIDRDTTPSGSSLTMLNGEGTCKIYWGENDGPVDTYLGSSKRMTVSSSWPFLCRIVWDKKTLGGSANWPNLEYEMEAVIEREVLNRSDSYQSATTSRSQDSGLNPAHVLWEVMTAPYPHGCGIPPALLNFEAFEELGEICQAERLAMNYLHTDGKDAAEMVKAMMADFGFLLTQIDGKLCPVPVRKQSTGSLPILDSKVLMPPQPSIAKQVGETMRDSVTFFFKDNLSHFRDRDYPYANDGSAVYKLRPNPQRVNLECITSKYTVNRVAARKAMEIIASRQPYRLVMTHGAESLYPGQPFIAYDYGQLRVTGVQPDAMSRKVQVEAIVDQYGLDQDGYQPEDTFSDEDVSTYLPPSLDNPWRPIILPTAISADPAMSVLRIRGNEHVIGSRIYVTSSNVASGAYYFIGRQDAWCAGGKLTAMLDDVSATAQITINNSDIDEYLDPPGADALWVAGEILVIIENEILYLHNCTVINSTTYQLNDLIRGQLGTSAAWHFPDSQVYVIFKSRLQSFKSNLFAPGAFVWVKSVPFTDLESADPADVMPLSPSM